MKKIVIEHKDGKVNFSSEGFDQFEIMGILRYHEKRIWLKTIKAEKKIEEENSEQENKIDDDNEQL